MEQIGYVLSADSKRAFVQFKRATACGENCAQCDLSCKTTKQTVSVLNPIQAQAGQTVKIELESKAVLWLSFIAYIVPLIMMVLGYLIADWIWKNYIVSDLTAILCLLLTFGVLHRVDRGISQKEKYQSKITKIIG